LAGIIEGVVAAIIFAALGAVLANYVFPAISSRLNSDVDIAGTWTASVAIPAGQYSYRCELLPRLKSWKGSGAITKSGPDGYDAKFAIRASRRGEFIVLTLWGSKQSRASIVTGLFHLEDRGSVLHGKWVYRAKTGSEVGTEEIIFHRST
jgi:hypothetical protein